MRELGVPTLNDTFSWNGGEVGVSKIFRARDGRVHEGVMRGGEEACVGGAVGAGRSFLLAGGVRCAA